MIFCPFQLDYSSYYNYQMAQFYSGGSAAASAYGSAAYGNPAAAAASAVNGLSAQQPIYHLSNLPPPPSIADGPNVIDTDALKTPGRTVVLKMTSR